MTSVVEIEDTAKSRLEELQAAIRLRTGEQISQQTLLTRVINDAYESREELVDSFRRARVPLSEAEKAAMRRGRVSSGTETSEDDVDDTLYG